MKQKSITLITQDFYPMRGGIASYLMQLYNKYFSNQKFQVIVAKSIGQESDYSHLPFEVFRTDFSPFELNTSKRKQINQDMIEILHKTNTDIILFGYLRSHPEVGLLYKKYNPRSKFGIFVHAKEAFINNCIVGQNHSKNGSHLGYLKEEAGFYKNILAQANYIFCVSNFTKTLISSQGIDRDFHIIYPPIKIYQTQINANELCKNHRSDEFTILSVGRLINRKGQDKVLRSIPGLAKQIPSLRYVIVGDGPNKDIITQEISNLGIEKIVRIYDDVDDNGLHYFYSKADIFVLPTDYIPPNDVEGFGIVFIEANMYEIPVIGGNTGGVSDAIIDGETGYLINPKSSNELESKVLFLYNNPELRNRLGYKGRKRVTSEFNNNPFNYLIQLFNQEK